MHCSRDSISDTELQMEDYDFWDDFFSRSFTVVENCPNSLIFSKAKLFEFPDLFSWFFKHCELHLRWIFWNLNPSVILYLVARRSSKRGMKLNVAFTLLDLPLIWPSQTQRNCFNFWAVDWTGQNRNNNGNCCSSDSGLLNHCFPNVEFFHAEFLRDAWLNTFRGMQ